MKYKIKFKVWAEGTAIISAENEEDAEEKLLAKDVLDIVSIMNIAESDVDTIEIEEI